MGIPDAIIMPFEPPAIRGVGSIGGFQFQIKDEGGHTLDELSAATQAVIGTGSKSPVLLGLFSSYSANNPQIMVNVDKFKAKQLNISLQDKDEYYAVTVCNAVDEAPAMLFENPRV